MGELVGMKLVKCRVTSSREECDAREIERISALHREVLIDRGTTDCIRTKIGRRRREGTEIIEGTDERELQEQTI